MLKNPDITIKLITGTWGTGKTLALVVAALDAVQKG
jgi:predicted ribonuclease YlaK